MMISYKIQPQLRENCVIKGKKVYLAEFNRNDVIFLISNQPTKRFSIISKIENLEYSDTFEEPKVFVDKRILGKLGKNDEVIIQKYNPAEALEVHLSISDEYSLISKGDWTTNLKPSLINKVVDLGQELSFLIPWEGGAPIVGSGIVDSTLPNPPTFIGERTKIFLDKVSNETLTKIKREKLKIQERRVNILEEQIKHETIKFIRKIKRHNYPRKGQKYKFSATNPKPLFNSIVNMFKGLRIIEEPNEKTFNEEEQDYLASAVFLNENINESDQLIDIEIISTGYKGTLILWVTGENEEIVSKLLNKYDKQISELREDLEQKVDVLSFQCPECAGVLPVKEIDIDGIVECLYCGIIVRIPKALRY